MADEDPTGSPTGVNFQRNNSESDLNLVEKMSNTIKKPNWERSQSEFQLENKSLDNIPKSNSTEYQSTAAEASGKISEQSKVYWDLSQAEEEMNLRSGGGPRKFQISLQTIHQKEEFRPKVSRGNVSEVRVFSRQLSQEGATSNVSSNTVSTVTVTRHNSQPEVFSSITTNLPENYQQRKSYLKIAFAQAAQKIQSGIRQMKVDSIAEQCIAIHDILKTIQQAWATPQIGRDLAYNLCDVFRDEGGLEILIHNCGSTNHDLMKESAELLEQTLTTENRDRVAKKGLEVIVRMSTACKEDPVLSRATTGILESLLKHSEETCRKIIDLGGLDALLYSCRSKDRLILRHCAVALANLAIYGGSENQIDMIAHKACEWLFPLAFSNDDSTRYYACLAIVTLSANKEIENAVAKSGTLELVTSFINSHTPSDFANADHSHIHGRSKGWLRRLIPVLDSQREEAQSLAAFHFAMEAGIKVQQDKKEIFNEIGAIEPLKRAASSPNKLTSKFACQALEIIGEEIPFKLSSQVALWTVEDVQNWVKQAGFEEYCEACKECLVDGDILLQLTDEHLKDDVGIKGGIARKRFIRKLKELKKSADYDCCDATKLDEWMTSIHEDFSMYTYQMIQSGVDKFVLPSLTDDHLNKDCHIENGIHRLKILEAIKRCRSGIGRDLPDNFYHKSLDVFISYRRSNGSQLASLLKVHLQLRGFTVFIDIEKLRAGKFDDNLLNSVRNAKHFILVLTPGALDRCAGDTLTKDWVHREVVAAIEGACNIIPITDNFTWPAPDSLPDDMKAICHFNGIRWIHDYQDACIDKLEEFLRNDIGASPPSSKRQTSLNSSGEGHGPVHRWSSTDTDPRMSPDSSS
ncbi:unnamed protein product [Owenia fusiformis]|uniref:ADP-ribosyl cyclase/cyclic ADP-ribose hydrolase n=1 Tax=Owenia fusiformis TaxID=6347 RepID=A0A8S4Q7S0_OWEFU|nr:unnamed protein product [Owenia fusiformis]